MNINELKPNEYGVILNPLKTLPDERYLAVLRRIRKSIFVEDGIGLEFCDDTSVGNKNTTCTWGLCSEMASHWPSPEDHIFPTEFRDQGRMSHLRLEEHQFCPMDERMSNDGTSPMNLANGCFWTCRVFQRGKRKLPSREYVLALYDEAIEKIEKRLGEKGV